MISKFSPSLPVVEMKRITKRFPGVLANNEIDLSLCAGEVHALLGENGAGKTTLMNILYGLYGSDSGQIYVRGNQVNIKSPKDAIALKIAMVHQHFELVPTLTVAENVALGLKAKKWVLLDLKTVNQKILELSKTYSLPVNPSTKIEQLSVGERQRVEIIKALYRDANVLILDEPTSVLTAQESEGLFQFLRLMAAEGRAVVIITHKLPEVIEVSQRVTVLRNGKVVARLLTKDTNPEELAEKMVGREILRDNKQPEEQKSQQVLLEVKGVSARNEKGLPALNNVSFELKKGEILGLAGVSGNGQTELAEVLTGLRKVTAGKILVEGKDLTNAPPREMIKHDVGQIPEDRMGAGLLLDMSIAENLVLEVRNDPRFEKKYMINNKQVHQNAEQLVKEYSISCSSVDASARTLSGGNMQKAILAKVLSRNPKILIAAQPTAGLDVGATEFIHQTLKQRRNQGVGIILISGDLNEITSLSDRIAVIFEGKIMGIMSTSEAKIEKIGLMMGGLAAN
jgi:general nucleoside transport system ATP-binding protein